MRPQSTRHFSTLIAPLLIAAITCAAAPAPPKIAAVPPHKLFNNPHLHGATAIVSGSALRRPQARSKTHAMHPATLAHKPWHNRWDAPAWQVSHLRYGAIRGIAVDSQGRPLAHAPVWLRYASGHPVNHHWEAHATHTDATGHFSMTHVIAKPYRFCVKSAGKLEHEQIDVHPGSMIFEHFVFQ